MKKQLLFVATFILSLLLTHNLFSQNSYTINAGNFYYTPSSLTINVGDTVFFYNDGGFHDVNGNINSLTGTSFNNPVSFYIPPVSGPAIIGSNVFNQAGTYQYDCSIGSHAANGMVGQIIVNPSSSPSIASFTSTDPLCSGAVNGNVVGNVTQGLPVDSVEIKLYWLNPNNGFWVNLGTSIGTVFSFNFPNLLAGDYRLDLNFYPSGTFIEDETFSLIDPPALTVSSSSTVDMDCNGIGDGSVSITASGGTPFPGIPPTYTYTLSDGQVQTGDLANFIVQAGSYSVTVTDLNTCSLSYGPLTVNEPPPLQASGYVSQPIVGSGASNGQITAQVIGGTGSYSYSINGGAYTTNSVFSSLSAGTYVLSYQDANSCLVSESIVLASSVGISSILPVDPSCYGTTSGNVTVNIGQTTPLTSVELELYWENPNTNSWVNLGNSNGTGSVFNFPNLTSGNYRIDLNNYLTGVFIEDTIFTLFDPPLLDVSVSTTDALCNGDSNGSATASVSGGTAPFSYSWSNNIANSSTSNSNLSAGVYNCIVTDNNGCTDPQIYTINEPALLQPNGYISQSITSNGGSNGQITAQAIGGTGSYTYSINGGAYTTNSIFSSLSAGTYLITYKDANNCFASESIALSEPPPLNGYLSIVTPVSCHGDCNGVIKFINVNSGTAPFTYILNGTLTQVNNPIFSNLCGDSVYTITATDVNNASLTTSIYLGQPAPLTFTPFVQSINGYGVTCSWDSSGMIAINNVTGGSGAPITYFLDTLGAPIIFGQVWAKDSLSPGDYHLAVKDAAGCRTYDTVSILAPIPLVVSLDSVQNMSCNGSIDGFIDISVTGGVGPYNFLWSNGETSEDISNLPLGLYTVYVTDNNGCVQSLSVALTEPAILATNFSVQDNFMPYDSSATINTSSTGGTAPYSYSWSGPNSYFSNQANITNLYSGTYYLQTTDANNCTRLDTVTIVEPGVIFGCTDSIALNYNASANTNNGTCYYCTLNYTLWSNNPSTPLNCNGWISVYTPSAFNQSISYYWSNGALTSDYTINNLCNGFYSVTIVAANGCGADTTILLSDYVGCMDPTALNYDPTALYPDTCIPYVYGCTDSTAANYNPLANTDDNSCVAYIFGCMDSLALNYNALADTSDGSCCYVQGCTIPTMYNYNPNACFDDGTCIAFVYGCIDPAAANYNPFANTSDSSCWYCVTGCMDSSQFNYDSLATCNGPCIPFIYGCTDINAFNYSSIANTNDSSCIPVVTGCTDSIAYNYDPLANTDDGSCYSCSFSTPFWVVDTTNIASCGAYAGINLSSVNGALLYSWNTIWGSYCCNPNTPNSQSLCLGVYQMTVTDMYGCTFVDTIEIGNVILGCTDPTAQNYNAAANIDDGSCCAQPVVDLTLGTWHFKFDWNCPGNDTLYYIIYDSNGTWSNSYSGNWQLCGNQYTHTYFNDQTVYTGVYSNGVITGTMNDGISNNTGCFSIYLDSNSVILGCNDSLAFNYNVSAQVDDGSCWYIPGCTDITACNYNALADHDDGSCEWNSCVTSSCGGITGINLTDVIHDRATFNWDDMNSATCQVDQIRIRYRELGTNSWTNKTMGAPVGNNAPCLNTSKLVLNLIPSTQYEYSFKIWYQNGTVVNWHANSIFTTADICDNVINVSATSNLPTQATFCWDTVSTYSFVRLRFRENVPGSSFSNIGGFGVFSPLTCKNKNGLNPGSEYRLIWRTWCDANGGPYRSIQWDGPVYWTQPSSTRLESGKSITNLDVYPNPSRGVFNIKFTSENIQDLRVRVLNIVGEEIVSENLQQFVGEYLKQVNLQYNAKGIYFLKVETSNGVLNKKLILQ